MKICLILLLISVVTVSLASPGHRAHTKGVATPSAEFQNLINLLRDRVLIARKIATYRWDTKETVADPPEEQHVVDSMVALAKAQGISEPSARKFFFEQKEANKDYTYALLDVWRVAGNRPAGPAVNLGSEVGVVIGQINEKIAVALKETVNERRDGRGCARKVPQAVATASVGIDPLAVNPLQRAVALVCSVA